MRELLRAIFSCKITEMRPGWSMDALPAESLSFVYLRALSG